jgi:hypothetical protein
MLPAVHVTSVTAFGSVLEEGVLNLHQCKFYKEDLCYFFYGKPAYRIRSGGDAATRILGNAAVCFLFDLSLMPRVHRAFAFDTGAYFGERYDDFLPDGMKMDDFGLPSDCKWLGRLVSTFFGKNEDYYRGEPKPRIAPPALDRASEVYKSVIQCATSAVFDDRACTCEIQFNEPISLEGNGLLAVVIPDQLFDDPEVRGAFEKWKIKPILYRMHRARSEERSEVIYQKIWDLYEDTGLM